MEAISLIVVNFLSESHFLDSVSIYKRAYQCLKSLYTNQIIIDIETTPGKNIREQTKEQSV